MASPDNKLRSLRNSFSKRSVILSLSKDQFRMPFLRVAELILRQAQDDGILKVEFLQKRQQAVRAARKRPRPYEHGYVTICSLFPKLETKWGKPMDASGGDLPCVGVLLLAQWGGTATTLSLEDYAIYPTFYRLLCNFHTCAFVWTSPSRLDHSAHQQRQ